MKHEHYDIVIIGKKSTDTSLARHLIGTYHILLVDEEPSKQDTLSLPQSPNIDIAFSTYYRNVIKNENGYTVILNNKRKNIQVSTNMLIKLT